MPTGQLIFSQLMDVVPKYKFQKIVSRYKGDYRTRTFTCWSQFLCLCFGQFTFRRSLSDLTSTLNALDSSRYHMGIKHEVALSTFSDANAVRPWQIYRDLAMVLVKKALENTSDNPSDDAQLRSVYALDSTTIDLCLSLFPWATFRSHKAAIKLHTLLDIEATIPTFIHISEGAVHDVNVLDMLPVIAGSIYIMDRGYLDFQRLYSLVQAGGQFVIRAKKNLQFYRRSSRSLPPESKLKCDQTIRLTGHKSKHNYPDVLRRVHLIEQEHHQDLVLLTNITDCEADQIADYYKQRWQIELFFKWIKQHLRIKVFYGQTPNAVKTQVWSAICSYVILVIVKNSYGFNMDLHTMMQTLSVTIMQRMALKQLFSENHS